MVGTIDLTNRYQAPGDRVLARPYVVEAAIVHHAAGWYGPPLTGAESGDIEISRIDAMAADQRARKLLGPAYNYVAFPSGRLYAVRKWGIRGTHTGLFSPESRQSWNVAGRAVCAMGSWESETPPGALVAAVHQALNEIREIVGEPIAVYGHRDTPSVNEAGQPEAQPTRCPGTKLLDALGLGEPAASAPGRTEDAYRAGFERGWSEGRDAAAGRAQRAAMPVRPIDVPPPWRAN